MITGALLIASLFFLPLWNITLEAPQYPDPIGMNIYIHKFEDARPNNIKNINIMNHYVGMEEIPETIPEFKIFPWVVGGMTLLGIVFGLIGNRKLYLLWVALMLIFGAIAVYDFYLWEYDYGHNLKENAAIKFTDKEGEPMAYQPPLIGNKTILNFKALSWPRVGAYLMFLGIILALYAYYQAKSEAATKIAMLLLMISVGVSCEVKPQKITYGEDACHFCKMTIVDKQHAAQLVTVKGKAFKYDAIECMMSHLETWNEATVKLYLVADYRQPGTLTNAKDAHYLISEAIPSPMGEFLTAFENKAQRDSTQQTLNGQALNWQELTKKYHLK